MLSLTLAMAFTGAFATQLFVARLPERTMFSGLLLSFAFSTLFLQMIGIGSAAMCFLSAVPIFISIVLDSLFTGGKGPMSLWAYALGQVSPLSTGTQVICTVFDVFVPLVSLYVRSPSIIPYRPILIFFLTLPRTMERQVVSAAKPQPNT